MMPQRQNAAVPNGDIKALASSIWAAVVLRQSRLPTLYALEKQLWLNRYEDTGQKWKRTGIFNKHANGRGVKRATLLLVDEYYPGTREWAELPLYRIISDTPPSLDELIFLTAHRWPKLASQMRQGAKLHNSGRRQHSLKFRFARTIHAFWRRGGLDALTALLSLARFADHIHDEHLHADAALAAKQVFYCVAIERPFFDVRFELYRILERNFFSHKYYKDIQFYQLTDAELDQLITQREMAFCVAEDLSLIKSEPGDFAKLIYWMYFGGQHVWEAISIAMRDGEKTFQDPFFGKHLRLLKEHMNVDGRMITWSPVGYLTDRILREAFVRLAIKNERSQLDSLE